MSNLPDQLADARHAAADIKILAEMASEIIDFADRDIGPGVALPEVEHARLDLLLRMVHDIARRLATSEGCVK